LLCQITAGLTFASDPFDWQQGIAEKLRVLRPSGTGLIMYLNEEPGGLFWDVLEILRLIVADEDYSLARRAIELLGIAPERIIQILDPAMVPINVRLTPHDI
jgi:hypothetical protein